MFKNTIQFLDLNKIYNSGQCFSWEQLSDNKYSIIHKDHYIEVEQNRDEFIWSCNEETFYNVWYDYFDLDNTNMYIDLWNKALKYENLYMWNAVRYGYGIRILKQDSWETIITFLISQNNNMKRIKKSVDTIRTGYGSPYTEIICDGKDYCVFNQFPNDIQLSYMNIKELKECGLGYRAEYIKNIADYFFKNDNGTFISNMALQDTESLIQTLKQYKGIGNKVANCIALYGFHRLECAPIDTHMKQIIDTHFNGKNPLENFKRYEGIIQQWLFDFKTN
jgi:N-glycosylase/DNA lyase